MGGTVKRRHLPLKSVYYRLLFSFIVIPLFLALIVALLILNQLFKKQALANIEQAQQTVIAELLSDIDNTSISLSHMIHINDNEILAHAARVNVTDVSQRNENQKKLNQAMGLILEPATDVVSVYFCMKDGHTISYKNEIVKSFEEIKEAGWYQNALENKNTVYVGSYDTEFVNDLYMGSRKDTMVLVFALSPSILTDASGEIEMALYYQSSAASERIKNYNRNYFAGKNTLGIMQLVDSTGNVIYATDAGTYDTDEYTCVTTQIPLPDTTWYAQSHIKTEELTENFWNTAWAVLGVAALIFLLASYFSSYFLRSIIRPVEEMSAGLKQVEEGNLDVHITPSGQYEIRTMIHRFNAMGRQLKALIAEYEDRVRRAHSAPEDYFAGLMSGSVAPAQLDTYAREIFSERHLLLALYSPDLGWDAEENTVKHEKMRRLELSFYRNPLFASRCIVAEGGVRKFYIYYRMMEDVHQEKVYTMVRELQKNVEHEYGIQLVAVIGEPGEGADALVGQRMLLDKMLCLCPLYGKNALLDLNAHGGALRSVYEKSEDYTELAKALYIADEKNLAAHREQMFDALGGDTVGEAQEKAQAAILAISRCFQEQDTNFSEIFGKDYNYKDKIDRLSDLRSIKLWLTNYFAWIMDYSASKLNLTETDVIAKAKRYMADNYENADLTLAAVADYAGLSARYFSNRFTKEAGETFSSYLTVLRLQRAKDLLKNTNFKIYEIAEMVGYRNAEHFNRMFKKYNGMSPVQYRKSM